MLIKESQTSGNKLAFIIARSLNIKFQNFQNPTWLIPVLSDAWKRGKFFQELPKTCVNPDYHTNRVPTLTDKNPVLSKTLTENFPGPFCSPRMSNYNVLAPQI